MRYKHLDFEARKTISSMIAHSKKLKEVAQSIGCDPTAVSKEVKRNRRVSRDSKNRLLCKKLDRWPYVCGACPHKYTDCTFKQLAYDAKWAQALADHRLHASREGIDLTPEEHAELNRLLKEGLAAGESLYSIVTGSGLPVSVPTVYRYIEERRVDVGKSDLPYAVSYKKRKRKEKSYDYPSNSKVDRGGHSYLDYLAYRRARVNEMTCQMDFLGAIRTDRKAILTVIIPDLHFVYLDIIEDRDSAKVVAFWNGLEGALGGRAFREVFPSMLTDRDPCFADMDGIEFSPSTGERRTRIFYCDAYKSNQKGSVENMNKQIRKHFPKGSSVDGYTGAQVRGIARAVNESRVLSLDGHSPREAFEAVFGREAWEALFGPDPKE